MVGENIGVSRLYSNPEIASKIPKEPCACGGDDFSLRKRDARGAGCQYVFQCGYCGASRSTAIKKELAMQLTGGAEPPPWDTVLPQRYDQEVSSEYAAKRAKRREKYYEYLASSAWGVKRAKVIERCRNVCEGCAGAPVAQVHHLTYAHVGNELLFELVGLCDRCHEIAHETPPWWMGE